MLLDKVSYGNELCLDKLLIKLSSLDNNTKVSLDITKEKWLTDYQLSMFTYVLSQIAVSKNIVFTIIYHNDNLFENDEYCNYLASSGFFEFMSQHNIFVKYNENAVKLQSNNDPLVQFQSFRNIIHKRSDMVESNKLLYELSSNMQILKELLNDEIFGKTDVSDKLTRIITKELVENINQHSKAQSALVRLKYEKKASQIISNYSVTEKLKNYLKRHQNAGFFVLTIADNGIGLVNSLKSKYEQGEFVPTDVENIKEMMMRQDFWWLKRSFEMHEVKDGKKRSRIGLYDILDVIRLYDGVMHVRTSGCSITCVSTEKRVDYEYSTKQYEMKGTYYLILLPAIERKAKVLDRTVLYESGKTYDYIETTKMKLRNADINLENTISAISTKIESSDKYIKDIVKKISKEIDEIKENDNVLLVIDFANAIKERRRDYIHILYLLYSKYREIFVSNVIIRNVADDILNAINGSNIEKELQKDGLILFVFDMLDRISFVGYNNTVVLRDIKTTMANDMISVNKLDHVTQIFMSKYNKIVTRAVIKQDVNVGDNVVLLLPFKKLFSNYLAEQIKTEIDKSKAIVDGHFIINDKYHVDKYMIAQVLFHNPVICRQYAKAIAIDLNGAKPSILLTYSTTGMIIYYYLKSYFFNKLKVEILKSPSDVRHLYGDKIIAEDKVLIVTDIVSTGEFNNAIKRYALEAIPEENICGEYAVISVGDKCDNDNVKYIYKDNIVTYYEAAECKCAEGHLNISSVTAPENTSLLPTVQQKVFANVSKVLTKKLQLKHHTVHSKIEKHKEYESLIDEKSATQFSLLTNWRWIQNCFQVGHVERKHTHFDHYDIPERLLNDDKTRGILESYVKSYSWSFENYIDYILYPKELTTSFLAHLVACRFLRKPKVAAAVRYSDGHLMLPDSISSKLEGKCVLIVDDACNTGITLKELIGLVLLYNGYVSGVFTITNRNSPENEKVLRQLIPKVSTAYRLNMEVYPKGDCPLCNNLNHLENIKNNASSKRLYESINDKINKCKVKSYNVA